MWKILQGDISNSVVELDNNISVWTKSPIDIGSVAPVNNKLQRLASGAKLNKAASYSDFMKSLQAFLETMANRNQVLDTVSSQLLSDVIQAMRAMAESESPAKHYQESESTYQLLVQRLEPVDEVKKVELQNNESETPDNNRTSPPALVTDSSAATQSTLLKPSSIVSIFLQEVEAKTHDLIEGLLKIEKGVAGLKDYEEMMRSAHSLKGGARLSELDSIVTITHKMEDVFSEAQQGKRGFSSPDIDLLMTVVDLLPALANCHLEQDNEEKSAQLLAQGESLLTQLSDGSDPVKPQEVETESTISPNRNSTDFKNENLQNIIRMAGDMKIDSQRFLDISKDFRVLYKQFAQLSYQFSRHVDEFSDLREDADFTHDFKNDLTELVKTSSHLFDDYEQMSVNNANVIESLSREALSCRMGVFSDCLVGIPRLVRDLSKAQNKLVELIINGESTPVDRDIITPFIPAITHLVQNAIDHGIGNPQQRRKAGLPETATLTLTASHRSGYLIVTVSDDGVGINLDDIKRKIIEEGMVTEAMTENLSEEELLSFIFLPRFTLKRELTKLSGRGVGLDIVHSFVAQAQGKVRVYNQPGAGAQFEFRLPVSLATLRCVIVDVADETYAIPVSQIDRVVSFQTNDVYYIEGRPVIKHINEDVYLFRADQQLGLPEVQRQLPEKLIVMKSPKGTFGFMVNAVMEEMELVDRPLHSGIGKLRDVRTASALPDGTPILILDAEDLVTNMEKRLFEKSKNKWQPDNSSDSKTKRVLVVDDSLTVREVERNMLMASGYDVDAAVDGVDGWNHLREGNYDLLVTDIDMPRMNGWELLEKVRTSVNMKDLPVVIVSYKDRQEDFERGLESGADNYVTKGSFQDDSFMKIVKKLIGAGTT